MPTSRGPGSSAARVHFERAHALERLADGSFDVLVIGGGITGAGVALDAASRGLRTALVEKDDFSSGTSSKSSKLVHGGIRYLQQRELRLVYENLAERQRLLQNAPHLVTPLPFLVPLFSSDGWWAPHLYRTALWLYDRTGGARIGRRYQRVTRDEALSHFPALRTDHLAAGFLYWDARTDDARLTLSVIRTAVLAYGATAVNHAKVGSLLADPGGHVEGAVVEPDGGDPFPVRAQVVVNATGVWADDVCALDADRQPASIRPAKGVHVTVPASVFPCDIAAVIPVAKDRRTIFAVPWGDQVYLGTTDTAWTGPLDDPGCLPEDVDDILDAANAVATNPLSRSDVTGVWAGLRPLLAPAPGTHSPRERTADLSRRHTVRRSSSGIITVTGGKLTTYRKMAEDTVDSVVHALGGPKRPCVTRDLRLHGAGTQPRVRPEITAHPEERSTLDPAARAAAHLAGRYGSETPAVLDLAAERADLLEPLVPGLAYLRVEALSAVRHEMASSLADVLERRTRAVLRDARSCAAAAAEIASLIGPELGWPEDRQRHEAAAYARTVLDDLARAGLSTRAGQSVGGRSDDDRNET